MCASSNPLSLSPPPPDSSCTLHPRARRDPRSGGEKDGRVRVHAFPSTWFIDPSIDRSIDRPIGVLGLSRSLSSSFSSVGVVGLSVPRSSYRDGVIEPDLRVDRRLIYGETRRVDSSAIPPSDPCLNGRNIELRGKERGSLILNFSKKREHFVYIHFEVFHRMNSIWIFDRIKKQRVGVNFFVRKLFIFHRAWRRIPKR